MLQTPPKISSSRIIASGLALISLFLFLTLTGCRTNRPHTPIPDIRRPDLAKPIITPTQYIPPARTTYIGPASIVVDPGHGGRDPGARGLSTAPEKTLNLRIALKLVRLLQDRGADVRLTRGSDRYITLDYRASMAESRRADLFVSIHCDSMSRSQVNGATVLIGRTASAHSKKAAAAVRAALDRAGIFTRPTRPQQLHVMEAHSRPAILVECGFLTNPAEVKNLNTNWYQAKIAAAIANGISQYFNQ